MPLSWNEIRHNAIRFSKEWATETREHAEAKSFWDDFFQVFGIRRRTVASFEEPVKKISGQYGHIDLFWPGVLLVEHKSLGKDLGKAESQAFRYIQDLAREGREPEIPRYVIVSDFARLALHDLEPDEQPGLPLFDNRRVATLQFPLVELHQYVQAFAFIPGYKQHQFQEQDPVNLKAAEILTHLHDTLEAGGYTGHDLQRFLVRILFCLFAEKTGIFEREGFRLYIENRTAPDGSDLGPRLAQLFSVLNTPTDRRQKNLDEELGAFPYVNGELFGEALGFAEFNRDMRNALLASTRFDWSRISPAVFGSLFQAVMEPKARRQIGGHYTSERDILKVIRSLFLDALRAEFDGIQADRSTRRVNRLEEFHARLCALKFLDPACGCGNFLVVTYRELRQLELELLTSLLGQQHEFTLDEVNRLSQLDVDQFYGIEILEWPARIAEVALWLMDHQMNLKVSEAFGQLYQPLPLRKSPHIRCANALRMDWTTLLPKAECSYVLGNPPFVGKKEQNSQQKADMDYVGGNLKGAGILDYVSCWYKKGSEYTQGTPIRCAFVSTNSICQGEQVGILWQELFRRYHLKLHFAHTTFAWESEAKGKAHVHVVIIGFGAFDVPGKVLFEYDTPKNHAHAIAAKNINPYLVDASDLVITSRRTPLSEAPLMSYGSMMIDKDREEGDARDGLILNRQHRDALLADCPGLAPFIRTIYGGKEYINGTVRWCLWLVGAPPRLLRQSALLRARIESVKRFRESSGREQTRKLALTPALFGEIRQPDQPYLLFPKVSSESRKYIPIGFVSPDIIASGSALIVPGATLYHFGVLSSAMHNAWMRRVAGRMKSDYQYSSAIVYNNFPWPVKPTDQHRKAVEAKARAVLDARRQFRKATLAELYDPLAMPPALVKAHAGLDRAVERCYREQPFESDCQRVEFLFLLYEKITTPLLPAGKPKRGTAKAAAT